MSKLTQRPMSGEVEILKTSSDISLQSAVGQRFEDSNGREFVLVQVAGTAIVAGHVVQSPAEITAQQGLTVVAFSAGTPASNYNTTTAITNQQSVPAQVTVTTGAAVTANQFAGGYLIVQTSTGAGQILKIASHPAAGSSASLVITLEDNPVVALSTSSTVGLQLNPYGSLNGTDFTTYGVITSPATTLTGQVIGVAPYALPASTATVASYGYVQTRGPVVALSQGGTTAFRDLMVPGSVAGATATYAVASGTRIGEAIQTATDGQYSLISIQL